MKGGVATRETLSLSCRRNKQNSRLVVNTFVGSSLAAVACYRGSSLVLFRFIGIIVEEGESNV